MAGDQNGKVRLVFLSRFKAFSPPRRKDCKGRQKIWTCLMVLSVLCVFAVQILGFGVFQKRLITDEGMSTTVADASGFERYVGKSEHRAGWVCFFFTACISRFPAFAENEGNEWKYDFFPVNAKLLIGWI